VPASLLQQLTVELHAPQGQAPARGTAVHQEAEPGAERPRHRTVVGQLSFSGAGSGESQTIGRTEDNNIRIVHPQVSSKHAFLHQVGDQLFVEDRGSANGTFVRGERIAPGQRVPVKGGEKVFIGPMPLLLEGKDADVEVVVEDAVSWEG
jgi:pSer/pThr/pTyr-binding forkhead associated (FHA) protein